MMEIGTSLFDRWDQSSWSQAVGREAASTPLYSYLIALAVACGGIAIIWFIKGYLEKRATKWLAGGDNDASVYVDRALARDTAVTVIPLLYLVPLLLAVSFLTLSASARQAIHFLFLLLFITGIIRFLSNLAALLTDVYLRRSRQESLDSASGKALMPIIRMLFWLVGITFLLDCLGFNITTIVAGLGIAGVAVGLAGQAILGDFFGYLVIIFDKPFGIGDAVTLGEISGTVESIGLKTTRIRTLGGELLVCPNGDLTKQRIANFRTVKKRGRRFTFGVQYETPVAKVRAIPDMLRETAAAIKDIEVNRVNFIELGASSLNFEVILTVNTKDLPAALAAQEELFLGLMERFEKEGIGFAYPTQRMLLAGDADSGEHFQKPGKHKPAR